MALRAVVAGPHETLDLGQNGGLGLLGRRRHAFLGSCLEAHQALCLAGQIDDARGGVTVGVTDGVLRADIGGTLEHRLAAPLEVPR
jgi:hypothetical protein